MPKNWPFDNNLYMPTRSTMSQGLPTSDDHYYMMFGRDDIHFSSLQHQGLGLFDGASDVELGPCSDDGNLADHPPSDIPLTTKCASCSTWNHQKDSSSADVTKSLLHSFRYCQSCFSTTRVPPLMSSLYSSRKRLGSAPKR